MNVTNYQIEIDPLAVGLTRQPTFMGVNIRIFFSNVLLCSLICIDLHTIIGIPLFIILHCGLVRLSEKEPNFIFILSKSFFKTPPTLNSLFWGKVNSYEPW